MTASASDWRSANRANWDERVAIHLGAACYELESLRAGRGRLNPIEEAEIGPLEGSACCTCNAISVATA
jgi:hypothetical protein